MTESLENIEEQVKWENVKMMLYLLEVKDGADACVEFLIKWIEKKAYREMSNSSHKYYLILEAVIKGVDIWLEEVPYYIKAREILMEAIEKMKNSDSDGGVYMSVPVKVPQLEEKLIMLQILTRTSDEEMAEFRSDVMKMKMSERFQFVDQVIEAEASRLATAEGKKVAEILLKVGVEAKIKARSLV